jgi:hypothetical protein
MRSQLPTFIKVWFAVDLVPALFPPVHWAMSGSEPILGIPKAFFIFTAQAPSSPRASWSPISPTGRDGHPTWEFGEPWNS